MRRTEYTQKWLDALRSGGYAQGTGNLYRNGAYCAIGVGAEVCGITLNELSVGRGYGAVHDFMGLADGEMWQIMDFNDENHLAFPEIADRIEAMLEPDECQ